MKRSAKLRPCGACGHAELHCLAGGCNARERSGRAFCDCERYLTAAQHVSIVYDLLLLVEDEAVGKVTLARVRSWALEERRAAEEWAGAVHLRASDNNRVKVPPRPDFLSRPWVRTA